MTQLFCSHPNCAELGQFKAPKDRNTLHSYHWFCLQHVREYNARWDYYQNMSSEDIERDREFDRHGRRPTWKFSDRFATRPWYDPFRFMDQDNHAPPLRILPPEIKKAIEIMQLDYPFDKDELKGVYKALAKKYHPDLNGGCKKAEERLKIINEAYSFLSKKVS
jgi:hypothetical protein